MWDYKVTINHVSKLGNYPILKTGDLRTKIGRGQKFPKLDISYAYEQLLLDEESRQYTTKIHIGDYLYSRVYPVGFPLGIFSVNHGNLLARITYRIVRLDDILASDKILEHLKSLK